MSQKKSKSPPHVLTQGLHIGQMWLEQTQHLRKDRLVLVPLPTGPEVRGVRGSFDAALDKIHYAGSCKRVGRCMRLFVVDGKRWVGGIVLGSTFPNIEARDEALDLKDHIRDYRQRSLRSPGHGKTWHIGPDFRES